MRRSRKLNEAYRGYRYEFSQDSAEPDEPEKIWHYLITPDGKRVTLDHSPYEEMTRREFEQHVKNFEETGVSEDKPYATMDDGPEDYLYRKDNKQKLVGSKDNDDKSTEEITEMDKELQNILRLAGIKTPISEDTNDDENQDGEDSPFTYGDENVAMVREEDDDFEDNDWIGKSVDCPECDGTGLGPRFVDDCPECDGVGKLEEDDWSPLASEEEMERRKATRYDKYNTAMRRRGGLPRREGLGETTWLGPYEDNEDKWLGQTIRFTDGEYKGEQGKVIDAITEIDGDGDPYAEFTIKIFDGPVVKVELNQWSRNQLELAYDTELPPIVEDEFVEDFLVPPKDAKYNDVEEDDYEGNNYEDEDYEDDEDDLGYNPDLPGTSGLKGMPEGAFSNWRARRSAEKEFRSASDAWSKASAYSLGDVDNRDKHEKAFMKHMQNRDDILKRAGIKEGATRQDFRMVANLIAKIEDPELRRSSAEDHARMFALQNPRFDREKFLAAAGADSLEEIAPVIGAIAGAAARGIGAAAKGVTKAAKGAAQGVANTATKAATGAAVGASVGASDQDLDEHGEEYPGAGYSYFGDEFYADSDEDTGFDDDRLVDIGDDEEVYDFDSEFEREMGNMNMYEMNRLRELAGLDAVEEDFDDTNVEVEEDGRPGFQYKHDPDDSANDFDAFDFNSEAAYYLVADKYGAEMHFGQNDEILIPEKLTDKVIALLYDHGYDNEDYTVSTEPGIDEDLQNGYGDHHRIKGSDLFPQGATSTPATDLGPTSSNHSDNPMAGKMRSKHINDDLSENAIYEAYKKAYRRFRRTDS